MSRIAPDLPHVSVRSILFEKERLRPEALKASFLGARADTDAFGSLYRSGFRRWLKAALGRLLPVVAGTSRPKAGINLRSIREPPQHPITVRCLALVVFPA